MKNFLLLNQSFGTVGSPNQTGETLTRENRVGLMSYLRRILMLLFAVLVMSVGQMWGTVKSATQFTSSQSGTTYTISAKSGSGDLSGLTVTTVGSSGGVTSNRVKVPAGTLNVQAPTNAVVVRVVVTWRDSKNQYPTSDSELTTTAGAVSTSSLTSTWTGSVNKVTLTNTTANTYQVVGLEVHYAYPVTHTLSHVSKGTVKDTASTAANFTGTYTADDGYTLPENISVSIGGSAKTQGTHFTWTQATGTISIPKANLTGVVVVTITGEAAAAGTTWYVKGGWNSWGTTDNLTGSGTELSATVNITTAGLYEFKIHNTDGDAWYGNGGNIGCNVNGWTFSTDESANCKFFASETGNYTFTFNTSTKELSVTYPTAQGKYYYKNTGSWGAVYVYRYVGDKNNGWPGTQVVETETICGDTYYFTYADPGTTLIFDNNNDKQTGDMTASGNVGKYVAGTGSSWTNFPTYTVTYNGNGSTGGSVPTDSNSPYACGSTVTVLGNTGSLEKTGHTFAGWNTAAGGGGDAYAAAETFTISANTTLYAQWELIPTYDITYNANEGTGTTESQTGNLSGAVVATRANGFTRSGYKFKWWNTAANGSGEDFYPGEKVTIASADVNLYAQWEQVSDGWEFWCGSPNAFTTSQAVVGDMVLTSYGAKTTINTGLTADPTIVSKYNSTVDKHAICIAVADNDQYVQVHFSDGSPINSLKLWATTNQTSSKKLVVIYSTTADFSSGQYEAKEVSVPANNAASKALTDFSPATADKYFYARIYRKVETAVYEFTGGSGNTARIYGVKAQKGANCTAPSALTAATPTAKGITLSVTDANNVNNYEFYVSTSSTAPEAGATATHSVSSAKSLTITNLVAGTTYYAWARSVCGVSNKSGWTALGGGGTFTTSTVGADYHLTNVTKSSGATTGIGGSTFTAVFASVSGYALPSPVVTIDGNAATSGTDYTWTAGTGTLTINADKITGNIDITMSSPAAAPTNVAISGTYHYYPGETISLTATPTGGNGPVTYQWYHGGTADGDAIDGATSATFTKSNCIVGDAGDYYCKVTCGGSASRWSDGATEYTPFKVKIMQFLLKDSNGDDIGDPHALVKGADAQHASLILNLTGGTTYKFRVTDGCNNWYGNTGTMTSSDCTNWTMPDNTDASMTTGLKTANYTFNFDFTAGLLGSEMKVSIVYPGGDQAADKVIYWDNSVLNWDDGDQWYRIGKSNHHSKKQMTKVFGTANLYKVTTAAYDGFEYWHIANNQGNGDGNLFWTKGDADKAITHAMAFEGAPVTLDAITVTPTTTHSSGETSDNDNCEFYTYGTMNGMKTQNVAISPYSNGTITVNYTNTSGSAATLTSGNADLAHSVILTSITAVADEGYDASAITINGGAYSANYVVTGNTTIAASFTPHVYTITLNKGDHGASNQSASVAYLADELTSITHVSSTGYTLTGYYDGSTKVLDANGSFAGTDITGYIEGGVWTKKANATLTAKWEAKTTTLTFDANTSYHGTTGDGGATATYDETALASVTHTTPADGYQLDGYYTTPTGAGAKIVTASGTLVASTSYTTAGGAWHSELANLTLYARYTDKSYSVTHTFTNASRTSGGSAGASAATHGTDYSVVVAATSGYTLPSTITVTIGGETATSGTEYTWNQGTGTVTIGGSYITGDIVITITSDVDCPSANSGAVVYKWEVKSNVTDGNICSTQNVAVSLNTTTHLTTLTGGTLQGLVTSTSMNNLAFSSGRIQYANGTAGVLILTLDCAVKTGDVIRFVNYSSNNSKYNYLRHTSNSTTTNQITLNASTTAGTIQEIVVPAEFNDKEVLYIVSGSNTTGISYFEIIRPYVVTLNANTNGGKVGGENTKTMYFVADEAQLLPRATKSDYLFKGWFNASSGGDAVANPYTATTSPKTLYAQFDDCSSTSGTVYKFQLKTGLTNGSLPAGVSGEANIEANVGNYLSSLAGGTMTIHNKNNHIQISDNSNLIIDDNGPYLIVNLDCALAAGDIFKSTTSTRGICVTKTATRDDAYTIPVGTEKELRVPAEFVGEKTLYLWRGSGSGNTKISYFEVYRPEGFAVTYNKNGHGTAPDNVTANVVTLSDITVDGWKNTGWTADVAVEVGGESKSAGTILVPGTEVTILAATTFTAQWTQTYLLTYDANGGSGAPSAEYRVAGAAALSSTVPTYSGYRFLGWNTESDGTGTRYAAGASYTMGTSAATLYAEWQEAATLTWEPNLNTAESSIGTKSKSSTNTTRIPTSAMSAIGNYGSLTITSAKKEGLTSKIATPASYDAGKYMYVTFTVPANYEFVPSSASVKVQPVGENEHKAVILELSDANGHRISNTPVKCDGTSSGKTTTVTLSNDGGVAFEGTVTLKIYVYAHADASASSNSCYRMGSPIAISGDVNYICPERATITSPASDQAIKLYTDRSKTLSISATAYAGTLNYQWQKDGVDISGATSASYTVDGSGLTAGTTYAYTCNVSETSPASCATVTSPAFNITAASPDCGYTVIAGATRTSGATTVASHEGVLYKEAVFNTDNTGKISGGKYVYLELTSGHYFQNGDKVVVTITTKSDQGTKELNVCAGSTTPGTCLGVLAAENVKENDDNEVVLSNVPENTSTITIHRTGNSTTQNHYVDAIKVKRYGCPDIFIYDDAAGTSEWSDEDNWIGPAGHGSGLPTSDDRIFINESVTVDVATAAAAEMNITNGSMVTVEKSITVGDVNIETGSTLNVAKDGESGITVATNSLYLKGGWNDSYTTYDMPRVYIDPASTLTKVVNTVNFDISVDSRNYYPIAVPFRVKVSDVDYANSTLASFSNYGANGQYVIKDYDGARRAENGPDQVHNWKVVPQKDEGENDVYLEPGRGYILTAVSLPAYGGGVIRFPMSFTNAWTANGEQGTIDDSYYKNVVAVTAYEGAATAGDKKVNKGWNLLGVPFMSCYSTSDDMGTSVVMQGKFNFDDGTWDGEDTHRYVNVPVHDFSEYVQVDMEDEETPTVLRPGWCFFVQIGTTGSLTFLTEDEAQSSSLPIYAPKHTTGMPTVKTGIILSGADASDKTTILVSDKYSAADYEINADLEKLFGNGYTLATYSLSGSTRLAYNAMSKNDATAVIPIGYRAPAEGSYTFSINPRYAENGAFQRVDLIDYEAGTVTNLLYGSYTFESARTQNDSRFAINVVMKPTITTDVETISDEGLEVSGAHKMIIDDKLYIILDGKMYDATGKVVKGGQK